jgi:prepilin-type N-terminal cleavage/methylation domain-containing protein
MTRFTKGFTIVELLIVIVVIGILATITIVAFNGVQNRAYEASLQSDLRQGAKQLALDYNLTSTYPTSLAAANNGNGLKSSNGTTFQYTYNNNTNPASFCLAAVSSRASVPSYSVSTSNDLYKGACTGLLASYFTNNALSGAPFSQQMESAINYNWGTGSPMAGMGTDNFSVRWTGFVTAPSSGTYTFAVTSDDGERLYVDNSLIIDHWVPQGPTTWTATVTLAAGQKVPIAYEIFENSGGAVAKLEWIIPGGSQVPIPASALSLT